LNDNSPSTQTPNTETLDPQTEPSTSETFPPLSFDASDVPEHNWEEIQLPASFQRLQKSTDASVTASDELPQKPKAPRAWVNILLRSGILLAGVLTALMIFLYALKFILPDAYKSSVDDATFGMLPGADPTQTVLVMGVDSNGNRVGDTYLGTRTDTMLLVKPNPKEQSLNIVSLPRDSKVYLDEEHSRVGKLNAAHAMGGPDKTRSVIADSLGVPVQKYLAVDFQAVRAMVDAIGGIDVYVPQRMRYTDNTAKLRIRLDVGWMHMDGKTAEGFLRFRHDAYGDIGRVRRQQQFMTAIRERLNSPDVVLRLPELIQVMSKYVHTNMNPAELLQFANYAKKIPSKDMRFATLPGHTSSREGTSYWIIDKDETEQVLSRLIYGVPLTNESEDGEPLSDVKKVGILYSRSLPAEQLTAIETQLETLGWKVVCRQRASVPSTSILDSSLRLTQTGIESLQGASPLLSKARVTFVPRSSSLTPLMCGSEQVTLYLGGDVVSVAKKTADTN
jgi:LCP family protein required for cell wall assembly